MIKNIIHCNLFLKLLDIAKSPCKLNSDSPELKRDLTAHIETNFYLTCCKLMFANFVLVGLNNSASKLCCCL